MNITNWQKDNGKIPQLVMVHGNLRASLYFLKHNTYWKVTMKGKTQSGWTVSPIPNRLFMQVVKEGYRWEFWPKVPKTITVHHYLPLPPDVCPLVKDKHPGPEEGEEGVPLVLILNPLKNQHWVEYHEDTDTFHYRDGYYSS